ncbi:TetR/AcrR family transcriptional regulator C-terminal domain-containing protein [Caloranaerobacter azorensis]|uniref:Transcriptional regulator, TetR family n=3 Tax=Caloranaerobacter azorensis TaxID=116090 RepID=A0A1M5WS74_9FIRM|nr:TetR/AcrR family transcriptional regulator C-terminal domain-containing protein [Caloranaerobacter azorensis]KGG79408.1 TetR family transcriptional regulator [Caloranaerobacter azorensis H53214]QIB26833.1 TetR family transcriptional regulator [Caloranaerobacter azorensis]SHH90466.1 transcriptional regulator, TetR family [Caloranaerobacter azorensis DSM 13643]
MSHLTELALAQSLKKLMKTTPLSKITVNDIVKDCGVNRRTLYYHFHDMYELLEWIFKTEIRDAINENRTHKTWKKGFKQLLIYLKQNKDIVLNTYHSIGREYLETHLYNEVFNLIYNVIEELSEGLDVSEENKKFIADFYKFAFVGLLLDWIKNDMKNSPDEIVENLDKIISGDIKKALQNFENKHK